MNLKPPMKSIEGHKTLLNIGAGFDIPSGYWSRGMYGESILMGGVGLMESIVGPGNMYKSTILHYKMLSAMSRVWVAFRTSCSTYDSEANIHPQRLKSFASSHPGFGGVDIIEEGYWNISDTSIYLGDEWYAMAREFMKDKYKNAKQFMAPLPFFNKAGERAQELIPTFSEIDSLTAINISAADEIMDKNDIGTSGGSHVFMRQGLGRAQMLHEFPALASAAKHFLFCTAHIGKNNQMSAGPSHVPPKKQLQHLPTDTKIKGVTDAFLYNQQNLYIVTNCALLWNKDDKTPKYPKIQGQAVVEDKDLNIVTLQHLRGKAGPSGFKLDIIVSQSEGVLPSLTEFNICKDYDNFGFNGNDRTYQLCLVPEENLQRTTVRQKLDESERLRRAMNITSELAQMHQFHKPYFEDVGGARLVTAAELYDGLKEKGYDINFLLDNTRGWWTYKNEAVDKFFLSTKDLVEMCQGLYHPYWLEDDKKTIKKEFVRK